MNRILRAMIVLAVVYGTGCRATPRALEADPATAVAAAVELDHMYTYAPSGVREEEVVAALRAAGLTVSERRVEFPEGGTGRYVFFDNAYLEVLLQDPAVPVSHADTRRRVAWERSGTSPFGIAFHWRSNAPGVLPVPTRVDTVRWLSTSGVMNEEELQFLDGVSDTLAPALFVVPPSMSYARPPAHSTPESEARRARERTHAAGPLNVAEVTLVVRPESLSPGVQLVARAGTIRVELGEAPLLEVTLASPAAPGVRDLRPSLPLVIRYQ